MRLSKARKEFVTAMMKDTIFEAAGSVLEEHGVNGITMDRVAATAGLAKGSLYNYFQDKDKLVRFLYAQLVEPFYQVIEEIADGDLPAPRKLEEILRVTVERSVKGKGIIRLLLETPQYPRRSRRRFARALIRLFTAIFQCGILDGAFRPHNPAHAARMFSGCLSELFEMWRATHRPKR